MLMFDLSVDIMFDVFKAWDLSRSIRLDILFVAPSFLCDVRFCQCQDVQISARIWRRRRRTEICCTRWQGRLTTAVCCWVPVVRNRVDGIWVGVLCSGTNGCGSHKRIGKKKQKPGFVSKVLIQNTYDAFCSAVCCCSEQKFLT